MLAHREDSCSVRSSPTCGPWVAQTRHLKKFGVNGGRVFYTIGSGYFRRNARHVDIILSIQKSKALVVTCAWINPRELPSWNHSICSCKNQRQGVWRLTLIAVLLSHCFTYSKMQVLHTWEDALGLATVVPGGTFAAFCAIHTHACLVVKSRPWPGFNVSRRLINIVCWREISL